MRVGVCDGGIGIQLSESNERFVQFHIVGQTNFLELIFMQQGKIGCSGELFNLRSACVNSKKKKKSYQHCPNA